MIAWKYLNKPSATIAAMQDYDTMREIDRRLGAQGRRMGHHSPLPPLRRAQLQPRGGGRQPHEAHVHRHEAAVPAAVPAGAH